MRTILKETLAPAAGLVLLLGVGACNDHSPTGVDGPGEPGDTVIIAFNQNLDVWPRDSWDLLDATVSGDSIHLEVGYSGGCRDHGFWLLAVNGFQSLPDQGITPTVGVPLFLAHDAHDDACDAYLTRSLTFGLQPLHTAFDIQYGDLAGRILLRVPEGQGSADTTTLDFALL